jgi:hypothetical protein
MYRMSIHNRQGAWMGDYSGETLDNLLQDVRNSEYDLSDCTGSIQDEHGDAYRYSNDHITNRDGEIVAK